jgi:hypothetical protein
MCGPRSGGQTGWVPHLGSVIICFYGFFLFPWIIGSCGTHSTREYTEVLICTPKLTMESPSTPSTSTKAGKGVLHPSNTSAATCRCIIPIEFDVGVENEDHIVLCGSCSLAVTTENVSWIDRMPRRCIRGRDIPSLRFSLQNALDYYSKSPHFPLNCVDSVVSTIIFHFIFWAGACGYVFQTLLLVIILGRGSTP